MSLPLKEDGTIDYVEATRLAKLNPPTRSPQEMISDLRALNAAESARILAMGADGPRLIAAEREQSATNYRRSQEAEGKLRTEAESKRLADAIAARAAEQASNPTPILDAQTEARRKYDDAIAAIQAKAAAPLTEKDLQDARDIAELRMEQKQRRDAAQAESLRSGLPSEKF
jgi:hypothetical protein